MQIENINVIKKCAPNKEYTNNSCFSYESLIEIAKNYNKKNNNNKIDINLSKEDLVKELEIRLSDKCSDQICWLRHEIVKELRNKDINLYTFRPIGPNKQYEWLNTININEVIDQYHKLYPEFLYLGAVPSDFEDIHILGISNLNFDELRKNNKYKIGLVINLDEHYKSGSHWVGLFFNLKEYQIYYFDSVGKPPIKRIKLFINKIIKYFYYKKFNNHLHINNLLDKLTKFIKNKNTADELNKYNIIYNNIISNIDIKYNNIQHQYKNSECGVYSINFIIRIINGESFNDIITNPTSDDEINKYREVYFRNVKIKN